MATATQDAFRIAIEQNDVAAAGEILSNPSAARELVNAPLFAFGQRPAARAKRNLPMIDLLLSHGADINLKSDWWAGGFGILDDVEDDPALADALIARGAIVDIFAAARLDRLDTLASLLDADPSLVHAKGGDGQRALHYTTSIAGIDLLLARGADIDARCVDHQSTALQWHVPMSDNASSAFAKKRLDLCRHLIARGATADVFVAAACDDDTLLTRLLDETPGLIHQRVNGPGYTACPNAPGEHIYTYTLGTGRTAHEVAHAFGSTRAWELLMQRSPIELRFAVSCVTGNTDVVRTLLATDARLMERLTDVDRRALPQAALNGQLGAVKLMLDIGFDPLVIGDNGGTALHIAAWHGNAAIVDAILSHPKAQVADALTAKDKTYQGTPAGWCCHGSLHCRRGDYVATARRLRAAGATASPKTGEASEAVIAVFA